MANQFSQPSGSVATSTTAKTVVAVITGSSIAGLLIGLRFSSDATVTSGQYLVEIVRFATDGTGTAGTPVKYGISQDAVVSTTKTNYTVEPSGTTTVVDAFWIPATGLDPELLPLGRELKIPVSTVLGIRVTAPSGTPNVRVTPLWEE